MVVFNMPREWLIEGKSIPYDMVVFTVPREWLIDFTMPREWLIEGVFTEIQGYVRTMTGGEIRVPAPRTKMPDAVNHNQGMRGDSNRNASHDEPTDASTRAAQAATRTTGNRARIQGNQGGNQGNQGNQGGNQGQNPGRNQGGGGGGPPGGNPGGGGGGGGGGPPAGPGGGGAAQAAPVGPPQATLPLTDVGLMLQVCGANLQEIYALETTERLDRYTHYRRLDEKGISELASRLEKRPNNQAVRLPMSVLQNLKVLCFWLRRKHKLKLTVNSADWDADELDSTIDLMEELKAREDADEASIKPEKLKPNEWDSWELIFHTYLSNIYGAQSAPIEYVIRNDVPAGHTFTSAREEELYLYPLQGTLYKQDNRKVFKLLQDLLEPSEQTWIQSHVSSQDGQAAWKDLVHHFDGGGNLDSRMRRALFTIDNTFYKDERALKFDSYAERMTKAYQTLDKTMAKKSEAEKVRLFLEGIKVTHPEMVSARREARDRHAQDLNAAIQHVSVTAAQLFPPSHLPRRNPGRNISAVEDARPSNRQRTTPDLEHNDGIYTLYGVDVTDVTRTFSREEFDRLGREGQGYVHSERLRAGRSRGRGRGSGRGRGRGYGGRGGRSVATLESRIAALESASQADDVSALTERQQDQDNNTTPAPAPAQAAAPSPAPSPRGSTNGSQFGSGTYRR